MAHGAKVSASLLIGFMITSHIDSTVGSASGDTSCGNTWSQAAHTHTVRHSEEGRGCQAMQPHLQRKQGLTGKSKHNKAQLRRGGTKHMVGHGPVGCWVAVLGMSLALVYCGYKRKLLMQSPNGR